VAYKRILFSVLLCMMLMLITTAVALAAEDNDFSNETCLQCHGAKNFSVEREGKTIPLYVDIEKFQQSTHGTNLCTSCHANIDSIPHKNVVYDEKLAAEIAEECETCHGDVNAEYRSSVHGQLEAKGESTALCADCHGTHGIRKKEDPESLIHRNNITNTCTKCHDEEVKESYAESFHGKAVNLGSSNAATCVSCHTGHKILGPEDPKSTVSKENLPETCAKCHFKAQPNYAKGIEHWTFEPTGPGAPMYWTLKFFTWLTIMTVTLLVIHIELELVRKYKEAKEGQDNQH